jgi:hypothetical protein
MLTNEIMDAAEELAVDNALSTELTDVDILHRISQMVQQHLYLNDTFGKLAIGSYRYHEAKRWEAHHKICELEHALAG